MLKAIKYSLLLAFAANTPAISCAETTKGVKTVKVDDTKVTWIQDNKDNKLMPASLFGKEAAGLVDSLGVQSGIQSSMSAFWVETGGEKILFDTGLGSANSQLLPHLKSLGIEAKDVELIYLTHFHGDHIGGMMKDGMAVFPNAEVYASRIEYEAWMKMPSEKNAQIRATMEAYANRLHLIEFGDTLPGGVVAMDAIGHTPGHTAYRAGRLLIIGDLIHGAELQLRNPNISASYDMDKPTAVKTRKYYLEYARKNNLVIAGMHLPPPGLISTLNDK